MDENVNIVTPESVKLSFETAGIGSRFIALLLDMLIQGSIIFVAIISLAALGLNYHEWISGNFFSWYLAFIIILAFLINFGYFLFFEMITGGRTPGKIAMKIRVLKTNGAPINFASSAIRNIFRLADMFPSFYALGLIVMFISKDYRRIGDYVAGTMVVKEYKGQIPVSVKSNPETCFKSVNPYPLTADEYRLIKEYLSRRNQLLDENRYSLLIELSERFYNKFSVAMEERTDREAFLEKLVNYNS